MANIRGNGVPTRKIIGGLGDIYTDVTTGKKYRCVGAYKCSAGNSNEFECEWSQCSEDETPAVEVPDVNVEDETPAVEGISANWTPNSNSSTTAKPNDGRTNYRQYGSNIKPNK